MPIISRWAAVYAIKKFPYARKTPGIGKSFAEFVGKREFVWATVFTAALVILLLGFEGMVIWFFAFLILLPLTAWINKKISGQTGDTYGAIIEITELAVLIIAYFIYYG